MLIIQTKSDKREALAWKPNNGGWHVCDPLKEKETLNHLPASCPLSWRGTIGLHLCHGEEELYVIWNHNKTKTSMAANPLDFLVGWERTEIYIIQDYKRTKISTVVIVLILHNCQLGNKCSWRCKRQKCYLLGMRGKTLLYDRSLIMFHYTNSNLAIDFTTSRQLHHIYRYSLQIVPLDITARILWPSIKYIQKL